MKVGDEYQENLVFTHEDVLNFAKVSGDFNPIHLDETYASKTIFKRPIIHGFLAGSSFSKIIGTKFPGEGTIYLKQDMKFIKPMYVGEKYIVRITISQIKEEKHQALLSTTIYNKLEEETILGEALVMNRNKI